MKQLFATRKARVALAVTIGLSLGVGVALPRIALAAPTVNVSPSTINVVEGNSGTSSFQVTFTLSESSGSTVSVPYSTDSTGQTNPATPDVDYVSQSGTVTFAAGDTSETVLFLAKGDTIHEHEETFLVKLGTPSGGGAVAGNNGTVHIIDDDSQPVITIDDLTKDEGNSGSTNFPFVLRLSAPSGRASVVGVQTADRRAPVPPGPGPLDTTRRAQEETGNVNEPRDYEPKVVDFAIPAGVTTVILPITVVGDHTNEYDEVFEVKLSPKAEGGLVVPNDEYAVGTIRNDDAVPSISVTDTVTTEGNAGCGIGSNPDCNELQFQVTLSAPSGKRIDFDYATEDRSATAGSDYTAQSHSQDTFDEGSFAPGETSFPVSVAVTGDNTAEPTERVALEISNVAPTFATIADGEGLGVINNDDGGSFPIVNVSDAPTVTEGGGDATFTITVSNCATPSSVTVSYATVDRTARAGQDYTQRSGTTQSILCSPLSSGTATVTVPITNDSLDEAAETFELQLTDSTNSTINDATGEAQINDNDDPPTVTFASDRTVPEGSGSTSTPVTFTVNLSGPSGQEVRVDYATTSGGNATAGADYTATAGTLIFAPGETSKTFDVPVFGDTIDEINETANLALSNFVHSTAGEKPTAVLTITDDDLPPTVSIANTSVTEGTPEATFQVSLSAPSSKTITVNAATANGTATAPADYTAKSETLTFNPGVTSRDFKVTVIDDAIDEADETFSAELTNPNSAVTLGTPSTATATIVDDGEDAPTMAITNATVNEGNSGTTNATFTVTLSAPTPQQVTVNYATADGTATQPGDYTLTSGTLTFAPNDTSETIVVPVKGDTDTEGDETFSVNLTGPINATLSDASGTGTITNDDGGAATTTTTSTTTTTTVPGVKAPRITTGPNSGGGPHIKVFNANGSGPTTQFMDGDPTKETGGKRVARGDLNGDGVDEIITGSGPNNPAIVSAYSATGQLIASSFAYANGNFYGGIFVAAGDTNGDGKDEILTAPGPGGGPHVRTWTLVNQGLSGNDGFMAYGTNFTGGVTIASADVNGDNKDDIITGPGAGGGPHVRAFSGATGGELFGFMAYTNPQAQPNWTGGVNVGAGDLDNDGKAEVAVTPWSGGGPHLRLFNHDGTLRNGGIFAGNPSFSGGLTVAVGDLDGDGNAEIVVGGMTQFTGVRGFKADLTPMSAPNFTAYEGFGGGVFVAIGEA